MSYMTVRIENKLNICYDYMSYMTVLYVLYIWLSPCQRLFLGCPSPPLRDLTVQMTVKSILLFGCLASLSLGLKNVFIPIARLNLTQFYLQRIVQFWITSISCLIRTILCIVTPPLGNSQFVILNL